MTSHIGVRSRTAYTSAVAAAAVLYWALGYAGLRLGTTFNAFASTIWPASGLALAVLLLFGARYWPAVFIGAFLVNTQAGASLPVSVLIGVGNSLEALLAAGLIRRFVGRDLRLDRVRDAVGLIILGAILGTLAGASVGAAALWGGGGADAAQLARVWLHWWVGDMVGVLVVTPFVLAFGAPDGRPRGDLRAAEAALLLLVAAALCGMIFGPAFLPLSRTSLTFLLLPPVVWGALRFEARGATAISLLVAAAATLGTLRGLGPFSQVAPEESVFLLALFIGVVSTTGLVLAASSAESRQTSGLRQGLDALRRVFDVMPVGVSVADRSGRITSANPAAERIGVDTAAGPAPHARDVAADRTYAGRDWPLLRALATGETITEKRIDVRAPDGRQVNLLSSAAPIRDAAGRVLGAVAVHHDVTALLAAQRRVERLARARTVMALCNQTLIHANSETQMLADMCRIVVEQGGHRAAWIGFAEQDAEKRVRPVASAGLPLEEIEALGVTWGGGPRGAGVTGAAIRSGRPQIAHDYLANPDLAAWRDFALRHGMHSVLSLPLNTSSECLGALVIYAGQPDVFDAEEIELLNELAGDIAFGVVSLRSRLQRELAEIELANRSELLRTTFESMDQGIVVLDRDLRIVALNRRYQTLLDLPDSLFAGRKATLADALDLIARRGEFGPGEPKDLVRARLETARRPEPYQIERERPDGTVLDVRSEPLPGGGRVTTYTDVTERKRAERAVAASRKRLQDMIDSMFGFVGVYSLDGVLLEANRAPLEAAGLEAAQVLGRPFWETYWWSYSPETQARLKDAMARAAAGETVRYEAKVRVGEGRFITIDIQFAPLRDENGKIVQIIGFGTDITEREAAMHALRESEELFRQLAGNIPEFFWVREAGSKERFLYFSPAWSKITGWPAPTDVQGMLDIVHPQDHRRVAMGAANAMHGGVDQEHRIVRSDGEVRWLRVRTFPIHDATGKAYRVAGVGEDITERKADQERLLQMAHYDRLTNLPNRTLLYDSLQRTLEHARSENSIVAVLFIDLDRFKVVNDTLGHAIGDALLQEAALRLVECVRIRDTVGRLGGDEFALILPALESVEASGAVADKLLHALARPYQLDQHEVVVTASIGITLFPGDAADADTLLRYADTAMYQAKQEGRNAYRYYTPELNARAAEKLALENSLRHALERGEFLLHYQPKLDLKRGEVCGVEALLRWQRPGHGLVPPAEFIPLLEETGLIVQVGQWVIGEACRQIGAWQLEGADPVPISVNISARQFRARELPELIRSSMRKHGVRPQLLECEITESSVMADPEQTIGILEELKAAGVGVSVDDFGTGYSSLSYLRRFPIDELKIDRSFVRDVATDPNDAAIARAIISMGHRLGLRVVAEGVENAAQLEFLRANGCDEAQGYLIARPAGANEILPLLHRPRAS